MLTHINEKGEAIMVDISEKAVTARTATAYARIRMQPAALTALLGSGTAGSREDIVRELGLDRWPFVDFKVSAAELIAVREKVNSLLARAAADK